MTLPGTDNPETPDYPSVHSAPRLAVLLAAIALAATALVACGDDDEPVGEPPSNERFTFEQGETGTHAGAYATVEVDGETYEGNFVEILLDEGDGTNVAAQVFDTGDAESAEQSMTAMVDTTASTDIDAAFEDVDLDSFDGVDPESSQLIPDQFPPADTSHDIHRKFEETRAQLERTVPSVGTDQMFMQSDDGCDGDGPQRFETVDEIGAFNGMSCYVIMSGTVSQAGVVNYYNWVTHIAPEGYYFSLSTGIEVEFPPGLLGAGWSTGFGCYQADNQDYITTDRIDAMDSIGISIDTLVTTTGFGTHFSDGYVRGFEFSQGIGVDAFDFLLFTPISFPMSVSFAPHSEFEWSAGPIAVRGWGNDPCLDDPVDSGDPAADMDEAIQLAGQGDSPGDSNTMWEQTASVPEGEPTTGGAPALSILTGDLFGWLNEPQDVGTADNIPAGSQADWYGEYYDTADRDECSNCANTTINAISDETIRRVATGINDDDNAQVIAGGMWGAANFMRSAPEFASQQTLQEGIDAAVSSTYHDLLASAAAYHDHPDRFISTEVLEYGARAGEVVDLPVTTEEVAELVDADTDDVIGAEVCLSTLRDDDEICTTLDEDELAYNYEADDPEPRLFTIEIDLADADGFDEDEVEEWDVELARRLVTPIVDEPEIAALNAPPATVSGAPVTLNAQLTDDNGRFVEQPATFRFYDAEDNLLDEVESDDGRASHQFIPEPVDPELDEVVETTLNYDDDEGIGYVIEGHRLSHAADVLVDGDAVSEDDFLIQYENPGRIIVAPRERTDESSFASDQKVEVVNPGDRASNSVGIESE